MAVFAVLAGTTRIGACASGKAGQVAEVRQQQGSGEKGEDSPSEICHENLLNGSRAALSVLRLGMLPQPLQKSRPIHRLNALFGKTAIRAGRRHNLCNRCEAFVDRTRLGGILVPAQPSLQFSLLDVAPTEPALGSR